MPHLLPNITAWLNCYAEYKHGHLVYGIKKKTGRSRINQNMNWLYSKTLGFLYKQGSLGKKHKFPEASIALLWVPSASFSLCSQEFPLIWHSETSQEFLCGLGPCCMSFLLQNSLSESFLLKSILTFLFPNCLLSSCAAHFLWMRGT